MGLRGILQSRHTSDQSLRTGVSPAPVQYCTWIFHSGGVPFSGGGGLTSLGGFMIPLGGFMPSLGGFYGLFAGFYDLFGGVL